LRRAETTSGIDEDFSWLLADGDIPVITRAFEKLSTHARTHRRGRVAA